MEVSLYILVWLLLAHFIGDFILQTNWMAQNKSKENWALLNHVTVYSLCFLPFGPFYALVNGILHFITDYFTSRLSSRMWARGKVHYFFVVVGCDQMIHYMCLFATFELLSGWPNYAFMRDAAARIVNLLFGV